MQNISVALDAMGGDFGPTVVIPAALMALQRHAKLRIILVGPLEILQLELQKRGITSLDRLELQAASQIVDMDESPALALRNKKDSSMRVAINLVKQDLAQACVSAGNTGALMAIARYVLHTLPGVDRPAIISALPSHAGPVHVLDLGANVDCSAEHLRQFAVMASIMVSVTRGIACPKVALLNVGAESMKGSEVVKLAASLLEKQAGLNYVGFVEGDDIYLGTADVIVCDGFVGNVALKTSEGVIKLMLSTLQATFRENFYSRFVALLARRLMRRVKQKFDPAGYNGATLLGLQGVVIKSHGGATILAFVAAIEVAMREAYAAVPEKIRAEVAAQLSNSA